MDRTLGVARIGSSAHGPNSGGRAEYVPGVCNIGPAEIARRRRSGWIGLIATAVLWATLVALDAPPLLRLLTFFPAATAAAGFLQAAMHFCAYFGFSSLFNLGPEVGKTDSVEEAEFRKQDRRKAWQIVGYSVAVGLSVAVAASALYATP